VKNGGRYQEFGKNPKIGGDLGYFPSQMFGMPPNIIDIWDAFSQIIFCQIFDKFLEISL
jgi:hypothetical protein